MALTYHVEPEDKKLWYWNKKGRVTQKATSAEIEFWESLNIAIGLLAHVLIWKEKTNWSIIEAGLLEIGGEAKIK